jgi:hypothetical protein
MDFEDEETWLHHHVMRLRMLLRYTRAKQAEALVKEMLKDAESRLEALAEKSLGKP